MITRITGYSGLALIALAAYISAGAVPMLLVVGWSLIFVATIRWLGL